MGGADDRPRSAATRDGDGRMNHAWMAGIFSLAVTLVLGRLFLIWARRRVIEPIASPSAELRRMHAHKARTPTMGGLFVVAAALASVAIFGGAVGGVGQSFVMAIVFMAAVGALDDLAKLRRGLGLTRRTKFAAQTAAALPAALWLAESVQHADATYIGDGQSWRLVLWCAIACLAMLAGANAVNLTDGLDGLASGSVLVAIAALCVIEAIARPADAIAEFVEPTRRVWLWSLLGATAGFLWFNRHPARVFMGDTGSLALGAAVGLLVLTSSSPLAAAVVCGVLWIELVSVVAQVSWFRWSGRRLLRCAPLHHHFQFLGWNEPKIVGRFWLAAAMFAMLGIGIVAVDRVTHAFFPIARAHQLALTPSTGGVP